METSVSKRGQTVVPAAIRRRYHIDGGSRLVWLDDGETISVVPVPADGLKALRGRGRGRGFTGKLLKERKADRGLDDSA